MKNNQSPDKIRQVAKDLDNALESKNVELVLPFFADDCEIELFGIKLTGKEGVRKWLNWLYTNVDEIRFTAVTIMVDGNTFFEEFVADARLYNGAEVQSKQAEVLIYENYKVKSLRIYFDRLDFAQSLAKGIIDKAIVRRLIKMSLKGLG